MLNTKGLVFATTYAPSQANAKMVLLLAPTTQAQTNSWNKIYKKCIANSKKNFQQDVRGAYMYAHQHLITTHTSAYVEVKTKLTPDPKSLKSQWNSFTTSHLILKIIKWLKQNEVLVLPWASDQYIWHGNHDYKVDVVVFHPCYNRSCTPHNFHWNNLVSLHCSGNLECYQLLKQGKNKQLRLTPPICLLAAIIIIIIIQ